MRLNIALAVPAVLFLATSFANAGTINFDFSFTGEGSASGTVTGEIFGLQDNTSNQAPTDVIITSAPANFPLKYPVDLFTADSVFSGHFTVSNGVLTVANWGASGGIGAPNFNLSTPEDTFSLQLNDTQTLWDDETGSVTFSEDPSSGGSAPEPATFLLGGLSLAAITLRKRVSA